MKAQVPKQTTQVPSDPTTWIHEKYAHRYKPFQRQNTNTYTNGYAGAANTLLSTVNINTKNINEWAILNPGATSHFLSMYAPLLNRSPALNPLSVTLPNGSKVQSTEEEELDIPILPKPARLAHVIPDLTLHSLLSVVTLCNAGCEVIFHKTHAIVKYKGKIVLQGRKYTKTGLWMVPLQQTKPTTAVVATNKAHVINNALHSNQNKEFASNVLQTSTKAELALFHHQSVGSPPKSTFLKSIRSHPKQWPTFKGLTYEITSKHLLDSPATYKGHMTRTKQGVQSTHNIRQHIVDARKIVDGMFPHEHIYTATDDKMYCFAILGDKNENTIYSDLTGRFPVRSYACNNYIFAAYMYDLNPRTGTKRTQARPAHPRQRVLQCST